MNHIYMYNARPHWILLTLTIHMLSFGVACSDNEESIDEPLIHVVETFKDVRHAFGEGLSQRHEGTFHFPVAPENVEHIRMFVKLRCPQQGCNAWDMFANIRVQDPDTGTWYETGRYITPYGVDNSALTKGFMVDVTDFKSLLTGDVKLQSFVEVWGNDGWLVSVIFEITEGTPDYPYYQVAEILDHAEWSLAGVPYGEEHDFVLDKMVSVPPGASQTKLRTIITGWGHATPADPDGRPCAEWCFRTHHVWINEQAMFTHEMGPIGCETNPVQPQHGNWAPDRAGWCPGMSVPVRTNTFDAPMAGESFHFQYVFEEWTNDFMSTADNKHAYYAISSYVIVKSDTPLAVPEVY